MSSGLYGFYQLRVVSFQLTVFSGQFCGKVAKETFVR